MPTVAGEINKRFQKKRGYARLRAMYSRTTKSIDVTVAPTYLPSHSRPREGVYVWSYEIEIKNRSGSAVQVRKRHWRIANDRGQTLDISGEGVIGLEPVIEPGSRFSYSSLTNLTTPSGLMWGRYEVETPEGETFDIDIPAFSLDAPDARPLPN